MKQHQVPKKNLSAVVGEQIEKRVTEKQLEKSRRIAEIERGMMMALLMNEPGQIAIMMDYAIRNLGKKHPKLENRLMRYREMARKSHYLDPKLREKIGRVYVLAMRKIRSLPAPTLL